MTERSFRAAYGVLQKHAQTLREQAEPNIDDLLTIVTESVAAYNVCKVRNDVVEAALKVALDSAGVGAAVPSATAPPKCTLTPAAAPAAAPTLLSTVDDMDEDIPF